MPLPTVQNARRAEHEEVQYLMGNPPSWMLRHGLGAASVAMLLLLGASYWIRYPDVQMARAWITTPTPPVRVLAPAAGRIEALLVHDRQPVTAGDRIAVLESSADWRDVLALDQALERGELPSGDKPLRLGALQGSYSAWLQQAADYRYFIQQNNAGQNIADIERQIANLRRQNDHLAAQKGLQEQSLALTRQELNRLQILLRDGVAAPADVERQEEVCLQHERQVQSLQAGLLQNELHIEQLNNQIRTLAQAGGDGAALKRLALSDEAMRLRGALDDWKKAHLVTAPMDGQVSLTKIWSAHQSVIAGEEVAAIVPHHTDTALVVRALLPAAEAAKVQAGMPVNLRVDGFPYQQHGVVRGQVGSLSLLPREGHYTLDISLPNALRTSMGKTLPFRQEMQGVACIITEDRRLLERLLGRVGELLKR